MSTVLITGGLGYVGGRISKYFEQNDHVIIASRRKITPYIRSQFNRNTEFISHEDLLKALTFPEKVDTVIHLAGLNEKECQENPGLAFEVNVRQTERILEASAINNVRKFLFVSTAHVYGKGMSGEIDESFKAAPQNPYSLTHYEAEGNVGEAHKSGKIHGLIVRISNAFGSPVLPDMARWNLLVNDIARQAVTQGFIRLKSNGCQFRDFITMTDVAKAFSFLIGTGESQNIVFNVSSGRPVTVLEMANQVAQMAGKFLKTDVPVHLPPGSKPSDESRLKIVPGRLLSRGFLMQNNFEEELYELIRFCNYHFRKE